MDARQSLSPSSAADLPACPFVAGPKIEDPRLFVGRQDELRAMRSRMTGAQPISLNVYGERRIGKSSLLYHFFQTNDSDPHRYVIAYVSLQDAGCATQDGAYRFQVPLMRRYVLTRLRADV